MKKWLANKMRRRPEKKKNGLNLKGNWLNNRKKIKMQRQIDEDRERWQHVRINQILKRSKKLLNNAKRKKTVIQRRNKKLQEKMRKTIRRDMTRRNKRKKMRTQDFWTTLLNITSRELYRKLHWNLLKKMHTMHLFLNY